MIYSDFQGLKLSRLGFGCMRFASDPETGEIDQKKVNEMFDLAVSRGVNYFDTAYPYLGGKSEGAMAEALKKYPRDSYYIADKFPGHSLPGPVDNKALFQISLDRCNTDYFDFYLLHNITEWSVKIYESEEYHIIPDILDALGISDMILCPVWPAGWTKPACWLTAWSRPAWNWKISRRRFPPSLPGSTYRRTGYRPSKSACPSCMT